jgi:ketosteroid isomerase-like protein
MWRFREDMQEEWEYLRVEIDELRDGADGAVVILGCFHNKTRTSGVEVDLPVGWVLRFEDGLISRWETFTAQDEALAAGGVPA